MASAEAVLDINKFTGLNFRSDPARIKDTELVECLNFDIGLAGEIIKRTGIKKFSGSAAVLGANAVTLLGYFQTDTVTELIARAGQSVYKSLDGGNTWAVLPGGPHGNVEFGVQYTNKFYMVRRDNTMLEYTGAAVNAIAGSPTGSHVYAYKDRLFVLNTYASGALSSRLYFSKIADFSAAGWVASNFLDVSPGDGDFLVCSVQLQDVLLLFKSRSTWMLYVSGDPTTWTLRNSSPEIGCLSRYTPRVIESNLYFVGSRGVYRTDGTSYDEISLPIHSVFFGQFAGQTVSIAEVNKAVAGLWEDKYIVLLYFINPAATWDAYSTYQWVGLSGILWGDVGGGSYQYFIYHLRPGAWSRWSPAVGLGAPFNMVEMQQPSTSRGLVMGSRSIDGAVYRYGDVLYQDNALDYECKLVTKEFDLDAPSKLKRGKFLVVEQSGEGVHTIINEVNGINNVSQVLVTQSPRLAYKAKGPGYFRVWQIISSITGSKPVTIFGYSLYLHSKNTVSKVSV